MIVLLFLVFTYCVKSTRKIFNHIAKIEQEGKNYPFETSTPKKLLKACDESPNDVFKLTECAFNFDTFANGKPFCVGDKVIINDSNTDNALEEQSNSDEDDSPPPIYQALKDVCTFDK